MVSSVTRLLLALSTWPMTARSESEICSTRALCCTGLGQGAWLQGRLVMKAELGGPGVLAHAARWGTDRTMGPRATSQASERLPCTTCPESARVPCMRSRSSQISLGRSGKSRWELTCCLAPHGRSKMISVGGVGRW